MNRLLKREPVSIIYNHQLDKLGLWCDMAGHYPLVKKPMPFARTIDEWVLNYCTEGQGWLNISEQYFEIKQGDFFICPRQITHRYGADTEVGWQSYWIHCGGHYVENYYEELNLSQDNPIIKLGVNGKIIDLFEQLLSLTPIVHSSSYQASAILHNLFLTLLAEQQLPQHNSAQNLLEFISYNTTNLEEAAKLANCSVAHFIRLFKNQTGKTPWAVVMERKIAKAKELLITTPLSIKEIAHQLNFEHSDYFAKAFSKHTGLTPKKYRGKK